VEQSDMIGGHPTDRQETIMTDLYQWWTPYDTGRARRIPTVFRMLNSVEPERALFTVPTQKLAERITYALRTARAAGLLLGAEPHRVPNMRTDKQHESPVRNANGWTIPARTYTLPEYDRLGRDRSKVHAYERPSISVRTRTLADALTRELDHARLRGMLRGNDARHYACHGHYGPCPHNGATDTLCANCGRYGQVFTPGTYDANCDRFANVWITAQASDWREGDNLCADCVDSFDWPPNEWNAYVRPDGIAVLTHV